MPAKRMLPKACGWTSAVLLPVLALSQVPPAAVVTGPSLRVEVTPSQERFFAKQGSAWVLLAVGAGETAGLLSIDDGTRTRRTGIVSSVSSGQAQVVENLVLGNLHVQRTLSLTAYPHWLKVTTRLDSGLPTTLHSFSDRMQATFRPDWSYSPSVGGFNPDAQYKAPLILVQSGSRAVGVVPDLTVLTRDVLKRCNHALDLDVTEEPFLSVGFIPARLAYHSVYRENSDLNWEAVRPVENSYYIYLSATAIPKEAFREVVRFQWNEFGRQEEATAADEQTGTGAGYTQCGLWDDWRRALWDEESVKKWLSFSLPDNSIGGAVRMLRWGRSNSSVYLGAWFNSMRTAYGMALYARRNGKTDLLKLAGQTLQMALKAPGTNGAFKCIAVPQPQNGPALWAAGDGDGKSTVSGFLGFDMSWTGYWLLRWRGEHLSAEAPILDRCSRLGDFFVTRQRKNGMLPTRFDEHGDVQRGLSDMVPAETAPVALFLLELYKSTPHAGYLTAALRGLGFLEQNVIPHRKWYDFETFWSCSPRLAGFDERTRQWPANNLALIHAAAAYLAAYQVTRDRSYLDKGNALVDYLLLYQQSWTNPALEGLTGSSMLLGGFTTQNSDAEWSDARQSLAGNVLLDYYRATGNVEYLERGVEALRSQFPVSPSENWAHSGYGTKAGVSSFHWGSGSGMAGIEIDQDYLKDAVFDIAAKRGVGVNGLNLTDGDVQDGRIQFNLDSPYRWNENPVVVFRNGKSQRNYEVRVNATQIGSFTGKALEAGLAVPVAAAAANRQGAGRR